LSNAERERDDALAEASLLRRNLSEINEAHGRTEQRLLQLQKTLTEAEEGTKTKFALLFTVKQQFKNKQK
jgi:hypothetical protein